MLTGRHLVVPTDFTVDEMDELFRLADSITDNPSNYSDVCKGKLMASLFFEPSTRTKFSFDAAMYRLGGNVLGFTDPGTTSSSKGESLSDMTKVIASYVDLIICRSPKEGAAMLMSKASDVPVINGGDGGHQHPTQTLTDLFTILHTKGSLRNHTVAICGDLKFGRTIHSLVKALSRYQDIKFIFISPEELNMPEYITKELDGKIPYSETNSLDDVIADADILYMSRVQKERFVSEEEYLRLKDYFILDKNKMQHAKSDMIVMHPLPRVNEISPEIDADPRCIYFKQVKFGMYIRMALIMKILGCTL